jgi:probable F420-dependent oxidoreductase
LPDPGFLRAVAQAAEELGYDSLWAGEHLSFENPIVDLTVALATFAAATEQIAVGAGVVLLPLRHPAWVAKEVGSLDWISGGRVLLGVGVGGEGAGDFEAAGVAVRERGPRADDAIRALRALWGPAPASYAGRHFSFAGVAIEPRPAQPGGPPILVAGRAPGALRRAGRLGDGWIPYMLSTRRYAAGWAEVRRHAAEADRDPDALAPYAVLFARVDEDGERARRDAQEHLSKRYGMRFERHHVEQLCVVGTPEECAARLEEYAAAGVRHVALNPAAARDELLTQAERLVRLSPARAAARPSRAPSSGC